MKKIIALLVVTLAFSLGANAQQKKEAHAVQMSTLDANKQEKIKQAAIADANELGKAVKLADKDKDMYISLFETKYRMYASTNNEAERNAYVADIIERKLSASLSADDLKKVNSTPGLMKRLTGK